MTARRPTRPDAAQPGLDFTDTERAAVVGTFVGIDGRHRLDTEPSLIDALAEAQLDAPEAEAAP